MYIISGLRNALREFHGGVVPNTHMRGSKQIDFVLTTGGLTDIIEAIGLLDCSVLNSDHGALFIDLCIEDIFSTSPEKLAQPQYRNLKLDDPRISEEYREILHKQFECHNIYRWVIEITAKGNGDECSLQDEDAYEMLDKDITEAMLHAERMCAFRKQHATLWTASMSKATNTIRYWDVRLERKGVHDTQDVILNYYLAHSDVKVECFDKTLTIRECCSEMRNARSRFKDILRYSKSNGTLYELEVAAARVERKHPLLTAENEELSQERNDIIQKEVKARENRRAANIQETGPSNKRSCETKLNK
jgi:hypothetical protein